MRSRIAVVAVVALLGLACSSTPPKEKDKSADQPAASDKSAEKVEPPKFTELPVGALRAIAADIERQVVEANREPKLSAPDGLIVDTPRIRQGARTRAARIELVNAMLDSGNAWERDNGRIWILRTAAYKAATTSRQRDIDAIMINGENMDRWAIYEGLVEANHLGHGALSEIEKIFFEARQKHMKPGQKYESSNGDQATIAAAQ